MGAYSGILKTLSELLDEAQTNGSFDVIKECPFMLRLSKLSECFPVTYYLKKPNAINGH